MPLIILRFLFPSRIFQMSTAILLHKIIISLSSIVTSQLQYCYYLSYQCKLNWSSHESTAFHLECLRTDSPITFVLLYWEVSCDRLTLHKGIQPQDFFCTFVWEKVEADCCSRGISLNLWFRYYTVYWLRKSSAPWEELGTLLHKYIRGCGFFRATWERPQKSAEDFFFPHHINSLKNKANPAFKL